MYLSLACNKSKYKQACLRMYVYMYVCTTTASSVCMYAIVFFEMVCLLFRMRCWVSADSCYRGAASSDSTRTPSRYAGVCMYVYVCMYVLFACMKVLYN